MSNVLRVRQSNLVGAMESAVIIATGTTDTLKGHIVIRTTEDGGSDVLVSNGQTVALLPLRDSERDTDENFTVPARALSQLLKFIEDDAEVELTHNSEDESILVTVNGKKNNKNVLPALDPDEFGVFDKKLQDVDAKGWQTFNLARLLHGMQFVREFISDDNEQKDLNLAACQGDVLKASNINVYAVVKFGGLGVSFNIPRHEVAGFVSFLQRHKDAQDGDVEIGHTKGMTFFRVVGNIFGFARVGAAFPNIKVSVDPLPEEKDHWMLDVKSTQVALKRVGVGQKLDELYIDVSVSDEKMVLTSDSEISKRTNQMEVLLRDTVSGGEDEIMFAVQRESLLKAIGRMSVHRNIGLRVKLEGRGRYLRLSDDRPVGVDDDGNELFDTYHAILPIRPTGHRHL